MAIYGEKACLRPVSQQLTEMIDDGRAAGGVGCVVENGIPKQNDVHGNFSGLSGREILSGEPVGLCTSQDRRHLGCHTRGLTFLFNGLLGPWERRTP
jgi:hypothetical protein